MKHTAEISKPKTLEKIMRGEFEYSNGILSLTCHTQNISFAESLEAITKLRDECQRQIDNQKQCPFHNET